ncbi:hypothetical protein AVEN_63769-1 [Araneus ventricosus]|uniref:Uncharacterized protein n=1 Tax=Araneus ventricosus TaxID=182803 RepID=A0A4Y2GZ17_ARAVE|nr:hypothetical protein AVEN_63769-1 [Araneus ventricosus]
MATLHGETSWPRSVIILGMAGFSLAGRHSMGILALLNLLGSYIIGRHHPLQLQQMDSCVWRETIHSLFSGDSAQQTVAPSSDFFEGKTVCDDAIWNQWSGYSSESAP